MAAPSPPNPLQHVEFLSEPYTIDRVYLSMAGPEGLQVIRLSQADSPELLWITGYRVMVVGPDGKSPAPQEFMCHNNLDYHPVMHNKLFGSQASYSSRLFTLSQGQFDVRFPEGFGLAVMSNEPLYLNSQVLNLNHKDVNVQVRHKVSVDFIRDRDVTTPVKPLFPAAGFVLALVEGKDGNFAVQDATEVQKHASCLPGVHAPNSKANNVFPDPQGRKFTGHWVVNRGREERHTLITQMLRLPYDTTIHFIAVHLHPFAESLELRDLTTGRSLYKGSARGAAKGIGLSHVDHFSSDKGIPVYKDHEYELVSTYKNTSESDQDAMAVMYFYLLDQTFKKPTGGAQ